MPKRILLLVAAAVSAAVSALSADFQIRNGDRVVFLGDSITEQRLYTTYIEAYALTRHPDWKLSFRNVGWGGDTSWLRQRAHPNEGNLFAATGETLDSMVKDSVGRGLGRDVLPLKPTFVTVKFGMNDHSYQKFRPDIFRAYTRSQTEIATVLKDHGARVTFLTPQPIEDKRSDPDKDARNQSLRQFSDGLKDVAAKTGTGFADMFDPYMGLMMKARSSAPDTIIGGGDAVHPGPSGQTLMAWAVLKEIGAPALVSSAKIDAAAKSVSAENCQVNNLVIEGGQIRFDRVDKALPWPVDARAESALKHAPVLDELSRYELKVTGLAEGTYELTIDGVSAGKASADQLAKGWNLSNQKGPITDQSRELLQRIFRKNDIYFARWREVQLYNFPKWASGPDSENLRAAELKRLDAEIEAAEARIEEVRQPKSHQFTLKPVAP